MDKEQLERDKRRAEKAAARVKAYQKVFGTPHGKKVLGDLMRVHGVMTSHPADSQAMALKEGERLVVLRILQIIQTNPAKFLERIADAESAE